MKNIFFFESLDHGKNNVYVFVADEEMKFKTMLVECSLTLELAFGLGLYD